MKARIYASSHFLHWKSALEYTYCLFLHNASPQRALLSCFIYYNTFLLLICWTRGHQEGRPLINLILTCRSIPGEVKEIFGARDGDHITNIGIGPAGDLVPCRTATWQTDRERPKKSCVCNCQRWKHHVTTLQQHYRCLDSMCLAVVRGHPFKRQTGWALELPWQPKPSTSCQLLLQPRVHNSGCPELTRCHHD